MKVACENWYWSGEAGKEEVMFEKLERKLVNVLLFFDLFKMKTKIPEDFSGVMRTQDKRVRKLVKRAYEIPFYRKRFDEAGVKPEDIRTGDDLSKLPLLTKDELRAWMNEEAKDPKYDCWFHDTTSGSSGIPLMLLVSPKEKAYNMAKQMNIPVLGIIENYSYVKCPDCGKEIKVFGESHVEEAAREMNVPVLGRMPIDMKLAEAVENEKFYEAENPYLADVKL